MATYSIKTQDALDPNTVQIAPLVDMLSTKEMKTGAKSLQKRSMRLMDAFSSVGVLLAPSANAVFFRSVARSYLVWGYQDSLRRR